MADYEVKTTQSDGPIVSDHPEEEVVSFYLLSDLLWEYNYRVQTDKKFGQGKQLLSVSSPLKFQDEDTLLAPLSREEAKKAIPPEERKDWWDKIKTTLIAALPVAIPKVSETKEAFKIETLINELEIEGEEFHYKTTAEGEIYVIIKRNPRCRSILTGARYDNTQPKIVELSLSEVTSAKVLKGSAVVVLAFYGDAKAVEGVNIYLEDSGLQPAFFSKTPVTIGKQFLSFLAGAGTTVASMILFDPPIVLAIAVGIVIGHFASVALDKVDEAIGLTKMLDKGEKSVTIVTIDGADDFFSDLESLSELQKKAKNISSFDPSSSRN